MLKADIALPDLTRDPMLKDDVVMLGESRIVPFPHASLQTLLVRTNEQWFVIVRERLDGIGPHDQAYEMAVDAAQFDKLYRENLLWPLDYVLIEAACAGQRLKIRSGAFGVAPLYCYASSDRIKLSWDFTDFLTQSLTIDMEIASHSLALDAIYSARQICIGITMLTERSSFYIEPGKARFCYPEAVTPHKSSGSAPKDGMAAFTELLQSAVSKRPLTPSRATVQLSGGMDSAAVASAVAMTYGPVASQGVLLDGDCRKSQIDRRLKIIARLNLIDEAVEMNEHPPSLDLQPSSRQRVSPLKEFYLEAFEALWDATQARGSDVLFTGIGGDELFLPYSNETHGSVQSTIYADIKKRAEAILTPRALNVARSLRGSDAPNAPLSVSALLAQACQAPHLLRRGLWPINPLCDPNLVAFCHQLTPGQRNRAILRRYLDTVVGSAAFPRNYVKETFVRVLPDLIASRAGAIASQLQDCALADFGLVDRDAVLTLLDEVRITRSEIPTAPLANFLWLERFARQLRLH